MQEVETETQTMGRDELIDNVIKKHEGMLEEFYAEYKVLDETVGVYERNAEKLKSTTQKEITDKDILDEKKHFFAARIITELESIQDSIKDIKQTEFEFTKRDIEDIISNINYLTSPKNVENRDEKKKYYEDAVAGIRGLYIDKGKEEQMRSDLETTYSSYSGLVDIVEDEEEIKSNLEKASSMTNEKKRYEWLKRRIESHEEALKYWKSEKGGDV
ncbi:MAG: hypothetical protein GX362_02820 [Methanosarcinaceae archaeon]|nr:hypothetical protein [Methanosarcinaceae archaeon]